MSRGSQWKVAERDLYGCERWLGTTDKDGYGIVWAGAGRPARAHRLAWEEAKGPIPSGLEIEHACRVRSCTRVAHMVLVDRRTNERLKRWRNRVKLASCAEGHKLELYGMTTPTGGRVCRICSK